MENKVMVNVNADAVNMGEAAASALKVAIENFQATESQRKEAEFNYHKLLKFRQDYVDRFDNEMRHYVPEETHQGFRSFFARLDIVISEQQEIIARLEKRANIQRELVQECRKTHALMMEEEAVH
jgi:hypothetical protein